MRLLDTASLDIVSFLADKTPPYAILSHTWGAEHDEPTLQMMQELTAAGRRDPAAWTRHPIALKKGYLKIRAACSLALSQGYRYTWIDMCCIDKTSSAELSEAINSMYRWYEAAAICYVFLEDVDVGPGIMNPDISRCRWFTRGWTLQELVAPMNVYFYDYKWSYIGSKRDRADFREQLTRTTGIDGRVLTGALQLDELSVACRMAWAASRTTTRPEDIAYCLMGIFQVNMPLLYGEGPRAFIRLQEEILKSNDDHSLFAWKCPDGDPLTRELSGLLAPKPSYFREASQVKPALPDLSRKTAPSTITNAGLHVQMHLRPIHANSLTTYGYHLSSASESEVHTDFVAVLDCAVFAVEKQEYCYGIRLVALGSGQYARIHGNLLIKMPSTTSGSLRYLYVKQKPAWVLPEIVVEHLEVKEAQHPYTLVDVHPSARWDRESKTLKSGRQQQGNALGGFRYKMTATRKGQESFDFFDVFIVVKQVEGQLGNWHAMALCREAEPGQTLQQAFDEMSKIDWSDMNLASSDDSRYRSRSRYGLTPRLEKISPRNRISFILQLFEQHMDASELDGTEVFGSGKFWTTSNLLKKRSEVDHLVALTKRMASEVVDDSLAITIRQSVNLVLEAPSKIRGAPSVDWVSNARADLTAALKKVQACCEAVQVTGANGGKLDVFEQYFSNRLALACIRGDLETAKELVQTKLVSVTFESKTFAQTFADPNLGSTFLAFRPIHWAAVFGHTEIVSLLSDHGAERDSKTFTDFTTLHLAAIMGYRDLLENLLDTWPSRDLRDLNLHRKGRLNEAPVHLAAAYNKTEGFGAPLKRLMLAGLQGGEKINEIRNGLGETPLHRAAAMNNKQAILAISKCAGRDKQDLDCPDGYERTPLWHAAATGAEDAVTVLLGLEASIDAADVYGRTPLHIACREGQAGTVRLLLDAGADVNRLTTTPSLSACHFTALAADLACLKLVIDHGGDAKLRQLDGLELGAVHIAAANGWLEGVRLLVESGCDPITPCSHFVMVRGHGRLDAGVNVARLPANNAIELALRGGHAEVVDFLKEHTGRAS